MRLFFIGATALSMVFAGCSLKNEDKNKKPTVLVSVAPYASFVEKISQGNIKVCVIANENTNPHLFEPTPKDVENAYKASLWIRTGEFFENKIAQCLKESSTSVPQLNLASKYTEHQHTSHEAKCQCKNVDKHYWMSPTKAREQILWIKSALEEALPEYKEVFSSGYTQLDNELEALAKTIQQKLTPYEGEAILVSHPAFGYFCKEFKLEQIPIEADEKEPTAKQILTLLEVSKKASIRAVLIQQTHSNKGALILAEQLKLNPYSINPYSKEYAAMIHQLTDHIIEGSCKSL